MQHTLPFPLEKPAEYVKLENEPVFDPARHLDLQMPAQTVSLTDIGYSESEIDVCPSQFGISSAFKILSAEGVSAMYDICRQMYANRNVSAGTGANRLGSYIRGAGYRSGFIKDFCDSPELAAHISKIAGTELARHSVPAVACGVNYAPDDITKAVDTWHTDSVAFDIVMVISDPSILEGGEFQYFQGTKMEGQSILGIEGEEGVDRELPEDRIRTVSFPGAGYGFMQQGNMIFHRACRLKKKAERITMIPSFVVAPVDAADATNSVNMSNWEDPGIVPELTRHEAWRASARLGKLVGEIDLTDDNRELCNRLDRALEPLLKFRAKIETTEKR